MDQWDDTHRAPSAWLLGDGDGFGDDFGGLDLGTLLGSVATTAATAAGIDPSITQAAQSALSTPLAKNALGAGLNVALGAVAKGVGGGSPAAVHADPSVLAAKANLPPAAHAAFDQGVALAAGHAAGAAVPGLTPAQQAANLIAAGAPSPPMAATPATSSPWVPIGAGALFGGAGALLTGLAAPVAVAATAAGAALGWAFEKFITKK